jgi:hypothetical protein
MIRDVHPGSQIPDPKYQIQILIFYPSRIPDPGVKKAPDPRSGSAILVAEKTYIIKEGNR